MIEIKNIVKSFATKEVLKEVSFTFEQGKTNLVIGQSGSGKTVLLKCLLGLHEPESGFINFDGLDIVGKSNKNLKGLRKQIGMVFQGGALFDSMNVEQNVLYPLQMFSKLSKEEMLQRVNFCLKRVNLENVNHLFPSEISGGMKKRVAIARAIVLNPKYLFCDEPNSGLDPYTATLIDNLLQEITHEYGMTTVINTHDMNSVMEIGEKILFIKEGRNVWEGTKTDIITSENQHLQDFVFSSELFKTIKRKS
ncbi:MAG: ATP-binding cassette domain-containing protein [Flavobacteriales bacterium]|jgi:phospholipid/cholesterol/gamma-HCH transport system ATP-binding protein|tara:strand:- start:552 stop:1304 length:753 start_codon:yes stop_codon:yes gene_type:complete